MVRSGVVVLAVSVGLLVLAVLIENSVVQIPKDWRLASEGWEYLKSTFSLWMIFALCFTPYLAYNAFLFFAVPVRYKKTLAECPSAPANLLQRFKNSGQIPPPYPNGWFFVHQSSELKVGQVKQVSVMGKEYALFRGEDGKARVLSAFCPHLGANLAIGGTVKDNCLTCPFHGWAFNGDSGKCVDIPYSKNIPSTANSSTVPIDEKNGVIYIWHHSQGIDPTWTVPQAEGLDTWKFRCDGYSQHEICAHIQEIPENGADVAHLNVLHTWPALEFAGYFGFTHGWSAEWQEGKGKTEHIANIHLIQFIKFLGFRVPGTTLDVTICQIGPGIVILQFNTVIGRAYIVQSVTPLQPMLQNTVHSVFMPWYIPRIIGKGLLHGTVVQVERDVPIWNNKTYVPHPTLCKGDGKINVFRRWFKQFYTPEDLDLAKQRSNILDW